MQNDRFIELLTRQLSSEITVEELDEFRALLSSNEANRRQYEAFKGFWEQKKQQQTDSEKLFGKIKNRITTASVTPQNYVVPKVVKRNYLLWRGIAAAVVIIIGGFAVYKYKTHSTGNMQGDLAVLDSTTTMPRARSIISLTDGTQVTLNSESTLKYPTSFNGKTREVFLTGEAFFDVHKDHEHPFIIHTGKMNIKVLGTAFNVKAYPKDLTSETTLIRGMIEITLKDRPSDRIILKPSDKLILKNEQEDKHTQHEVNTVNTKNNHVVSQYTLTELTHLAAGDTAVVETSWLKNKLIFRNEEFASLALRMQRWYGVNITFSCDTIKVYRFNGTFETETLDEALFALKRTENFHYKITKTKVFIY